MVILPVEGQKYIYRLGESVESVVTVTRATTLPQALLRVKEDGKTLMVSRSNLFEIPDDDAQPPVVEGL